VTTHRIEIVFAGDAPDSELERAKILGSKEVGDAIAELQSVLANLQLDAAVTAHSVRKMPKLRSARLKLQEAAGSTDRNAAE
jgi:hypothetical protein